MSVRDRKALRLFGVIVMILAVTLVYFTHERDPVHKGQRLSQHLQQVRPSGMHIWGMNDYDPHLNVGTANAEALVAISAVGTNALPMLVHMLGAKESRLKVWLLALAEKHKMLEKLIGRRRDLQSTVKWPALVALQRLGPQAAPAVPMIIPLLKDPDSAMEAMLALSFIRPEREEDILALTNVLSIQQNSRTGGTPKLQHAAALLILSKFGDKASGAAPFLIQTLASTNGHVAAAAAVALARIGAEPEQAVPRIIANLSKTYPPPAAFMPGRRSLSILVDSGNIMMNLWALGQYGPHARIALPVLTNLEHYPVSNVQEAAREAAAKISTTKGRDSQ